MLSASERARYSRHLLLPEIGNAGQEKLKAARVLIVGAGGLGSPAGLYLAAAGVGTLGIVDHDHVEISNLQRQILFDTSSLGFSKATAAQARLSALNPEITLQAHEVKLQPDNAVELIQPYDLVVDGSDRLSTRYLVNDVSVILGKSLVSAAIHRFEGQAMTYKPAQGPCYRCLFPESAEVAIPNCAEAGVLGVLPGILGALQATEALKLILGIGEPLLGRLLTFDALAMRWQEFKFSRRTDCAVCGEHPSICNAQDSAAAAIDSSHTNITRLGPEQLHSLMSESRTDRAAPLIIDVRETQEFSVSHIDGAMNIPMQGLSQGLVDIPLTKTLVFVCYSGGRSLAAGKLALDMGRSKVAHLEGGMMAWARARNPHMIVAAP